MQIGTSFQANVFSFARPSGGDGAARASLQSTTASVTSRHDHHHGHGHKGDATRHNDGAGRSEGRTHARFERMAAMLQRWAEFAPQAQGAPYAAIVSGGNGLPVAATTAGGTPGDILKITAQSISDVVTSDGDDTVVLQAAEVRNIATGAGSDNIVIVGGVVSGIRTGSAGPVAAPPPPPAEEAPVEVPDPVVPVEDPVAVDPVAVGPVAPPEAEPVTEDDAGPIPVPVVALPILDDNDALSVAAYLIDDIATGEGDDALALRGKSVTNIDAGAGNDAIAIKAQFVSSVTGGDGDDAIAVKAWGGPGGLQAAESWFRAPADAVVATNGAVSASVDAAARAYADIDGGAGNDVISVRTATVLGVNGGTGDDTINIEGGTVALLYGAQGGKDTVNVAEGSQVVLQIADDVEGYSVSFGENSMTVTMGEGSVTFAGIGAGTVGIKHGDGGIALISQPGARALNLAL